MNKAAILELMAGSRARLLAAIDGLSEEDMLRPDVMDGWSVKDILAHIAAWQSRLVRLLFQLSRGQKPQWDARDVDAINAEIYTQQKDRPLPNILADFHGVYDQARLRIEALDEADLAQRIGRATLAQIIRANADEHDDEHTPQIEIWRAAGPS